MESVDDERRSQTSGRPVLKRLILLRHAKSSWDDAALPDDARPLAARGERDAPEMGRRLAAQGVNPGLILTSPAVRARRTAEIVASCLGTPLKRPVTDARIYLASPGELLDVISGIDDAIDEAMLVGHNPGLTQFVNMLLPDFVLPNLPTGAAVGIDCATERWSAVDAAEFALRFYEFPKKS